MTIRTTRVKFVNELHTYCRRCAGVNTIKTKCYKGETFWCTQCGGTFTGMAKKGK